jgi:hypothetical protein
VPMLRRKSRLLTAGAFLLLFLAGCKDALSQHANLELLEAVMFAIYGVEGTSRTRAVEGTWTKGVMADRVEFQKVEFDEDASKVLRRNERILEEDRCVFRRESRTDIENLEPPRSVRGHSKFEVINLHEASRFDAKVDRLVPLVILEGPSVYCPSDGQCQNSWNQMVGDVNADRSESQHEIARRRKAIALIKRSCPGKPY